MSSGRVADNVPRGALPTAVRTPATITAEVMESIPQYLSFFQQMLHSRKRLRLTAERYEGFSFEIEKVLFRRCRCLNRVTAAQNESEFSGNLGFMIRDVTGFAHEVNAEF